jgi:hypothetical protein
VLTLLVLLLVVGLVLGGLLYVWTTWFQGYIYSEPAEQLYWRAPAAAGALTLYLAFWVFLDARAPGDYQVFTQYSASRSSEPYKELRVTTQDGDKSFKLFKAGTYTSDGLSPSAERRNAMPSRPDKITVEEGGKEVVFERKEEVPGGWLMYRDASGRTMSTSQLGVVTTTKGSWVLNLLVNLLFLGAWFACLWFLLEFQWTHALIQAAIVWIVMLLFVVGPLLSYAENLGK